MPATLSRCPCCARALAGFEFAQAHIVCRTCCTLPVNEAVSRTIANLKQEAAAREFTKAGRRAARRERLLALIARDGKRCTSCHAALPASAYAAAESRGDGLQVECRTCMKLRNAILARAGATRADWYTLRDALRAQHAKGLQATK